MRDVCLYTDPSAALAEAAIQYSRLGDPALSAAMKGVGEATRAVNAVQQKAATVATRQHQQMLGMLASPSVADARGALDKASRRFDKDKYKKRGSLQLRGLSLEVHQRGLQQVSDSARPPSENCESKPDQTGNFAGYCGLCVNYARSTNYTGIGDSSRPG